MRLLLDSHALIWWLAGDARCPQAVRQAVQDAGTQTFVSAASAWEITTKFRSGKLPGVAALAQDFEGTASRHGFHPLAITIRHAQIAGSLQVSHKDPFDRMLIAQALVEGLVLVSNEAVFDGFGVQRLW